MNNRETEAYIKRAFDHAAPDDFDSVMADCTEQNGGVLFMEENKKKNLHLKSVIGVVAACIVIAIGLLGFHYYSVNYAVDSTISLDVNPSIELNVNQKEKVLSVKPLNEDGKTVLGNMELEGSNLEVCVNAIIGSMLRNGYLSDISNSILVSIDGSDPERSSELQKKLSDEISALLQTDSFSGAVLSQTIQQGSDVQSLAEQYGITQGKAQLIQQIVSHNSRYNFADLVPLPINELNLIASTSSDNLADIESSGTASDKGYIGEKKAKDAALSHAGLSASDIYGYTCEMDYENGTMVYELEFKYSRYEYSYDIDAVSGKILKYDKEFDDDYRPASGGAENTTAASGHSEHTTAAPNHSGGSTTTSTTASSKLIGASAAKKAAFKHSGVSESKASQVKCKLDWENGKQVYEIEFKCNGYEYSYDIDAVSGKILKYDKEFDDDYAHNAGNTAPTSTTASSKLIGASAAKKAAFKHSGVSESKARQVECKLDWENGRQVYEIEFKCNGYEYSYDIDAVSGKILKYDKEFDD